jgi:hypothetical protein
MFGSIADMRPIARHEIEGLRRSLTATKMLPPDEIVRLLDTCEQLLERRGADDRIAHEIEALRPVVAELRLRLTRVRAMTEGTPPSEVRGPARRR